MRPSHIQHRGFSLVEVVLALGVTAFAVTTILALLGSVVQQGRDVIDRQYSLRVSDAIGADLQQRSFAEVYSWASSPSTVRLHAFNFYAKPDGVPFPEAAGKNDLNPDEFTIETIVLEPTDSRYASYEDARAGSIVAAVLSISPNNPVLTLSPPPDDYPHAHISLRISLHVLEEPLVPVSTQNLQTEYDVAIVR